MALKHVVVHAGLGTLGQLIVKELLSKKSYVVTALVRPGSVAAKSSTAQALQEAGATVLEVDFKSPAALKAALNGVAAIISAVSELGFLDQLPLIEAAKEAGVKTFIPSEFNGGDLGAYNVQEVLLGPKLATRAALEKSGLAYTYIQIGLLYDYLFTPFLGIDPEKAEANVFGTGDLLLNASSYPDAARFAVDVLEKPESRGRSVQLASDKITINKALDLLEKVTGKKFKRTHYTLEETRAGHAAAKADPNPLVSFMAFLHVQTADPNGYLCVPRENAQLSSARTQTIEEYVNAKFGGK
eukprot:TRINITY_DN8966_c0_g1_i2.p1 TRINITY_DN8966_c0_g1~~TRINITY_DN8966_c0_g1_i2.p1  ORF type:complete len:299 (-),score=46.53 TRINITY_DN8966_c0_g1_i2:121-1017(-)